MSAVRVLVTRPQPGASKTADRLSQAGYAPVILPLSQTSALPVDGNLPSGRIDAVIVTSVNALRHAPADLIASLVHHRCFAVGSRTAAAARKAGFRDTVEGPGDAAGLVEVLLATPDVKNIVYLAGRVRRDVLEPRLTGGGMTIRAIETYDTLPVSYGPDDLELALGDSPIEAVLLYSAKAAEGFSSLLAAPLRHFQFENTRYFCLSSRIATALDGVCTSRIYTASRPTEDDLLARLAQVL